MGRKPTERKNPPKGQSKAKHRLNPKQLRYYESRSDILTQRQLDCVTMYHFKKLSQGEIAERLGVCQATVSQSLKQAAEVLETGVPSMYYRRADTKEIPWRQVYRKEGVLSRMMMKIVKRRFRDHAPTSEIARELGITQPQVSSIISACSTAIQRQATKTR